MKFRFIYLIRFRFDNARVGQRVSMNHNMTVVKLRADYSVVVRSILYHQKNLIICLYFSENMTLYDQTKMTELKRTTTVQRSITSKNRHTIW